MERDVSAALKQIGEPFPFTVTERFPALAYGGRTIGWEAPIRVSGTVVFDGTAITVDATAETTLRSVCGLCNEVFSEPMTFPVKERFIKEQLLSPGDEEVYPFKGERLDLTKAVTDNLLLNLPIVSLCSSDCKGLCPICGVNRNVSACSCQPAQKPGPFSALAGISDEE